MNTTLGFHSSLEDLLKATRFAVEATNFERHCLWQRHHKEVDWKDQPFGYMKTIGSVGDMPVVVSLTFHFIESQLVMFFEATSQMVDHRMVDKWLEENVSHRWDHGTRRSRTDAGNFHLCLHALAEGKARASEAQAVPA